MRWLPFAWFIGILSCGGGNAATRGTTPGDPEADPTVAESDGEAETEGGSARWTGRAEAAWAQGDIVRAEAAYDRALAADNHLTRALVGKGRCLIARGQHEEAAALLDDVDDAPARSQRAMALYLGGQAGAAAALEDLAPTKGRAKDMLQLTRALRSRTAYEVEGRRVAIPLLTNFPLPAVPGVSDGTITHFLVDTGAFETVIDRAASARLNLQNNHGVIGSLELGNMTLKNVPVLVRDLSGLARSLGAPVSGVIGMRLLAALHATIDYPSGWLVLRADAPEVEPGHGVRIPYFMIDGEFLTIRARVDEAPEGAVLLSGGGTFAVALSDEGLRATGRDPDQLTREADGFARYAVAKLRAGSLEVSEIPAIHFVFPERLIAQTGVHFAGVLSHAFLAQWRLSIDSAHHTLVFEQGGEQE